MVFFDTAVVGWSSLKWTSIYFDPPSRAIRKTSIYFDPPSPGDHPPNAPLIKTNPLRSYYKNSRKSVNVVRINMFNTSKCIRISRGTHWWGCACAWEMGRCVKCVKYICHFSFSRFWGSSSVVRKSKIQILVAIVRNSLNSFRAIFTKPNRFYSLLSEWVV